MKEETEVQTCLKSHSWGETEFKQGIWQKTVLSSLLLTTSREAGFFLKENWALPAPQAAGPFTGDPLWAELVYPEGHTNEWEAWAQSWKLRPPTRPGKAAVLWAGLSLLHHKVEAARPPSGSQLSNLQVGKWGKRHAGRREGKWEHRQEAQLEMSCCPWGYRNDVAPVSVCVCMCVCVCVCVCACAVNRKPWACNGQRRPHAGPRVQLPHPKRTWILETTDQGTPSSAPLVEPSPLHICHPASTQTLSRSIKGPGASGEESPRVWQRPRDSADGLSTRTNQIQRRIQPRYRPGLGMGGGGGNHRTRAFL